MISRLHQVRGRSLLVAFNLGAGPVWFCGGNRLPKDNLMMNRSRARSIPPDWDYFSITHWQVVASVLNRSPLEGRIVLSGGD